MQPAPICQSMSVGPSESERAQDDIRDQLDAFWDRLIANDGNQERAYPRVQADLPVLVLADNEQFPMRLHDIGRGGLQLRCDRETAARVAPGSKPDQVSVTVRAALAGDEDGALEADCALVHLTFMDPANGQRCGDVAMGFQFEDLEPAANQVLETFILKALEPAI